MSEIKIHNKKIHYRNNGQGAGVILVHGFGENGAVFSQQITALSKYYKVVVPDLPGSGSSDKLEGRPSLVDFADILYQIAQKEFPDQQYNIFGHSMGGYITMAFAEKYSDRLISFGLLHSSAYADTEAKKAARKKGIGFVEKNGGRAFLKTITNNLFAAANQSAHPELIQQLLALSEDISDEAIIQYYDAMMHRPDRSHILTATRLPVLFISGAADTVITPDISLKQSTLPLHKSVHILENSGHMGMWEESSLFNRYLIDFLQQHN